ncbi:hypothetical protein [Streptacidiphilus sp. EB103A]|uniref:hypothetical protein n=1 Tax=Streptacidiphilus sp. EB103A TaxID=3156275 RepID=UPI0035151A30
MTTTVLHERYTADQLADLTPAQIDYWASDIATARRDARTALAKHLDTIHHAVKDRDEHRRGSRPRWLMSDEKALELARDMLDRDNVRPWDRPHLERALEAVATARATIADLAELAALPHHEWLLRRWSRFFLVTSSTGGHIHSSDQCSRREATEFQWLPDLAGRTEQDAVNERGPLLCTHCFPTAPLEWTRGIPKPTPCPGAGQEAKAGTVRRRGMRHWGTCTGCEETFQLTGALRVFKHQPPASKPAA